MKTLREYAHIEARYWNGNSSAYGTCDQLIGMLRSGWRIATIGCITRCIRGRFFTVYMFELRKSSTMTVMHVVDNPVIRNYVKRQAEEDAWVETSSDYEDERSLVEITVLSRPKLKVIAG